MTVLQHGDSVTFFIDLIQSVGNKNHGYALCLHLIHDAEEDFHLVGIQGGCGLIHNQQLAVEVYRTDNRDNLLLRGAVIVQRLLYIDINSYFIDQCLRVLMHLLPVDTGFIIGIMSQENILADCQIGNHVQLLVNGADSCFLRALYSSKFSLLIVKNDLAGICFIKTC